MERLVVLGAALTPLLELCSVLEREKTSATHLRSEKLLALKSLGALWSKEFPARVGGSTVVEAAKAVLGIIVHVILAASSSEDGAEAEASIICLGRVLGSLDPSALAEALPVASALRVLSALSMALPPPLDVCALDERRRSEEEILATLGCLRVLVCSGSSSEVEGHPPDPQVSWLATPGTKTDAAGESNFPVKQWRENFGAALADSEEGRGALAQIVHAALTAARGGPPSTASGPGSLGIAERRAGSWPTTRLPRAVGTCALALLDGLVELLASYPTLWRQFLPGIASQLFQLLTRGAASRSTALLDAPSPSTLLGSLPISTTTSQGSGFREGSGGFATAADLTRGRAAAPASTAAHAMALLARVVALTCADAAHEGVLGASEALDWDSLAASISPPVNMEKEEDSPGSNEGDAQWRSGAAQRLETVLAGTLAAARAHESWRVRVAAIAAADLLLLSCRRFLGQSFVGVALDTLAILCEDEGEDAPRGAAATPGDSTDEADVEGTKARAAEARVGRESGALLRRAAKSSIERVQAFMGPVAWRQVWDAAAGRLDELVLELRHAARPGGSEATTTDRLKLLAGLLDLLNSSSSSSNGSDDSGAVLPLPLADVLSAMAMLMQPEDDKAAVTSGGRSGAGATAVLTMSTFGCGASEATVGYFRRPLKFLRSAEASSAARRALKVLGCVAMQRGNLANLIEDALLEMTALDAAATGKKEGYDEDDSDDEEYEGSFAYGNHPDAAEDLDSDLAWEKLSAPVAQNEVRRPRHPSVVAAERRDASAARLRACGQAAAFCAAVCELLHGAASSLAENGAVIDSEAPEVEACRCFALEMLQGSLWAGVQHEEEDGEAGETRTGAEAVGMQPQNDLIISRSANGLRGMTDWTQGAQCSSSLDQSALLQQHRAWAESRAWVVAAQLEMLGCMAQVLGDEFEEGGLLMSCLFPVLALTADPEPILREAAKSTATRFAAHGGYREGLKELLGANLDYVVDPLLEFLLASGSSSSSVSGGDNNKRSAKSNAHAVLESLLVLSGASAAAPLLRDVLAAMVTQVDKCASSGFKSAQDQDATLTLLAACLALVRAVPDHSSAANEEEWKETPAATTATNKSELSESIAAGDTEHAAAISEHDQLQSPCMTALLNDFADSASEWTSSEADEVEGTAAGLDEVLKRFLNEEGTNDDGEEDDEEGASDAGSEEAPADAPVTLVLSLLPRFGYWLAKGHGLRVQVAAVRAVDACVHKLRARPRVLLPQVHALWPALAAVFRPDTSASSSSRAPSSNRAPRHRISAASEPFLDPYETNLAAAACDLIATLSETCGDFLAFKFDEDLWPSLVPLLTNLAKDSVVASPTSRTTFANADAAFASLLKSSSVASSSSFSAPLPPSLPPVPAAPPRERSDRVRLREALLRCLVALATLPQCRRFVTPVAGRLTALVLPFLALEAAMTAAVGNVKEPDRSSNGLAAQLIVALYELDPGGVWHTLWLGLSPSTAATYARSLFERRFRGRAEDVHGQARKPLVRLPTRPLALVEPGSNGISNGGTRGGPGARDNTVLRLLRQVNTASHAA